VAKSICDILAWVAETFEAPAEKIRPETKRDEIDAWDSLGILTLMARLDEDFHILLTEEEIQQLRSVEDILNLLRKRGVLGDNE
jgi:acyl carrier protein